MSRNTRRKALCRKDFQWTLKEWFRCNYYSARKFCKEIKTIDHTQLSRILKGERPLSYRIARLIFAKTRGEITYADMYDEETLKELKL